MRILQIWFMPNVRGLDPSYETRRYNSEKLKNALLPIVDPQGSEQIVKIHQDLTLYLCRLDKDKDITFRQEDGRRIFLFVIEGRLTVNNTRLGEGDTARIESLAQLSIMAEEDAFLMLIDLP